MLPRGMSALTVLCITAALACAQESRPAQQALEDAYWTGPMLAPSAATLPRGHLLIEPYLYFVRRGTTHRHTAGSLTYVNYGLTDRLTVGMIPTFGYNTSSSASSSGPGVGDLTVQAQHRLTKFRKGSWVPATSIAVLESLPTGRYDRLGTRIADGFGSGAYVTSLAFYSQRFFWLPTGRILRMRFNVTHAFPAGTDVCDRSIYGTSAGFQGRAHLGQSTLLDAAWEYSVTRNWVLAIDATFNHSATTVVTGREHGSSVRPQSTGSGDAFAFAPAVEYNWTSKLGVLLGVRVIPPSHNTAPSITPAVAINFVR